MLNHFLYFFWVIGETSSDTLSLLEMPSFMSVKAAKGKKALEFEMKDLREFP